MRLVMSCLVRKKLKPSKLKMEVGTSHVQCTYLLNSTRTGDTVITPFCLAEGSPIHYPIIIPAICGADYFLLDLSSRAILIVLRSRRP
jgi:hypothetical protein